MIPAVKSYKLRQDSQESSDRFDTWYTKICYFLRAAEVPVGIRIPTTAAGLFLPVISAPFSPQLHRLALFVYKAEGRAVLLVPQGLWGLPVQAALPASSPRRPLLQAPHPRRHFPWAPLKCRYTAMSWPTYVSTCICKRGTASEALGSIYVRYKMTRLLLERKKGWFQHQLHFTFYSSWLHRTPEMKLCLVCLFISL